jgi:hypothetical protein
MSLVITTPPKATDSWRNGRLICAVKDAATQLSVPMRHSVELIKKLDWLVKDEDTRLTEASRLSNTPESTTKPYCLVLRSDGGTDRNPKHFSVKIAMIFLMLLLDLDCSDWWKWKRGSALLFWHWEEGEQRRFA